MGGGRVSCITFSATYVPAMPGTYRHLNGWPGVQKLNSQEHKAKNEQGGAVWGSESPWGRGSVVVWDSEPRPSPCDTGVGAPLPHCTCHLPPGHHMVGLSGPMWRRYVCGGSSLLQHNILVEDRGRWLFKLDSVA